MRNFNLDDTNGRRGDKKLQFICKWGCSAQRGGSNERRFRGLDARGNSDMVSCLAKGSSCLYCIKFHTVHVPYQRWHNFVVCNSRVRPLRDETMIWRLWSQSSVNGIITIYVYVITHICNVKFTFNWLPAGDNEDIFLQVPARRRSLLSVVHALVTSIAYTLEQISWEVRTSRAEYLGLNDTVNTYALKYLLSRPLYPYANGFLICLWCYHFLVMNYIAARRDILFSYGCYRLCMCECVCVCANCLL